MMLTEGPKFGHRQRDVIDFAQGNRPAASRARWVVSCGESRSVAHAIGPP
jgi:hypothetical protein